MNLLARTIEEYLDEHHQEWCVEVYHHDIVEIVRSIPPDGKKYIIINSKTQAMIAPGITDVIAYTEITILPLLTSIISQLEVK